ncbi:hypothetical protein RRSWK_01237 [Rhodopirellula sp. SWK7]|nr:hypothetical protein RRSWK_01237 [Rhodopirellula sp. SWK7]
MAAGDRSVFSVLGRSVLFCSLWIQRGCSRTNMPGLQSARSRMQNVPEQRQPSRME